MMSAKGEAHLLRMLTDQNPWWASGRVPDVLAPPFRRRDFYVLRGELSTERITAVVGPRQVGKTVLLYQTIQEILTADRKNPRNVLFLAMDFPQLQTGGGDAVTAALDVYSERIIATPWRELKDTCYVFLDEIAKLPDWDRILKGWYDRKLPLKFVISDSSHSAVRHGIETSLVGRCDVQLVLPMKFVDVLMFHEGREDYNDVSLSLRKAFAQSVEKGSPDGLLRALRLASGQLAPFERRVKSRLQQYLYTGGYPEFLRVEDLNLAGRRLREYVDLIFARDLLRFFDVRNPKALSAMVGLIADQTGQRFDYATLAKNVNLSPQVVREYLDYLESVLVVTRSEFWTKSRASRVRKQRKLYMANAALANGLTGNVGPQVLHEPSYFGRLIETVVADHALRLLFVMNPGQSPDLFYWRNYRGQEVDIVLRLGKRAIPLEVKYQEQVTPADRRPVIDFIEEEKSAPFGIIVTKDDLGVSDDVVAIPLFLFLLLA